MRTTTKIKASTNLSWRRALEISVETKVAARYIRENGIAGSFLWFVGNFHRGYYDWIYSWAAKHESILIARSN